MRAPLALADFANIRYRGKTALETQRGHMGKLSREENQIALVRFQQNVAGAKRGQI